MTPLSLEQVRAAATTIQPHIWPTPLLPSAGLSQRTGGQILLKMECWQVTGSFKVRGALNKLASLTPGERHGPLVTASAGNHGLGVAHASQRLHLPAPIIFVPSTAPAAKLERLAALPCKVRQAGPDYDAAHLCAELYAHQHNALYLSAYDDPAVVAGQGTVGLEILHELAHQPPDLLLVPVGGGGLIAGVAVVAKALSPGIRLIGIQPAASPAAQLSLRDGHPYETYPASPTICDGLAGGFGRIPFEIASSLIDDILIVPEEEVRRAIAWLLTHEQLVTEGSAAIAVAPLLSGQLDVSGQRVVSILTGRNLDATLLLEILAEQHSS
jgi:threonine dehydratase